MLGKNVARKTLFNWKKDGEWDEKRKKYIEQNKDTKEQLKRIVDITLERAEGDPTPKNLLALLRSIQAFESYGGIKPQIEGTDEPKKGGKGGFSPEAIEAIKGLYGLKS